MVGEEARGGKNSPFTSINSLGSLHQMIQIIHTQMRKGRFGELLTCQGSYVILIEQDLSSYYIPNTVLPHTRNMITKVCKELSKSGRTDKKPLRLSRIHWKHLGEAANPGHPGK